MTELDKVKFDAFEIINKYPQCEGDINEAYEIMMDEIQDGESEDNEIEHFYSNLHEIIHTEIKKHITSKTVKEHKN